MLPIRSAIVIIAAVPILGGFCGYFDRDPGALTIATPWTVSERAASDKVIREALPEGTRIRWIQLAAGDELAQVVSRRSPPDLVLGGPTSSYDALAEQGKFEPALAGGPSWMVALRLPFGLVVGSRPVPPLQRQEISLDDPRRDPVALAWAEGELRGESWADEYATLVRDAGVGRRPGRNAGAARAAVERGEAKLAPARAPRRLEEWAGKLTIFDSWPGSEWVEGMGIVKGARHVAEAKALVRALAEKGHVEAPTRATSPAARSLLADLLGATLVEAGDELVSAWSALEKAGHPERSEKWMTQPPPWPPASVSKLLERESNAMPLVETLAAQVAPEADARAWLLRSWLSPPRQIDGPLLDELAGAVDGRLAREPRFRSWLRGEWTAWARQRYRRVARQAGGWKPRANSAAGGAS